MQYSISQEQLGKLLEIFVNADYEEVIRFKRFGEGKEIIMYLLNKKGVVCKGCKEKGLELCDHLDAYEFCDFDDRKIVIQTLDGDTEIAEDEENGLMEDESMPISESDPHAVTKKDKYDGEIATLSKDPYGNWGNFVDVDDDND